MEFTDIENPPDLPGNRSFQVAGDQAANLLQRVCFREQRVITVFEKAGDKELKYKTISGLVIT